MRSLADTLERENRPADQFCPVLILPLLRFGSPWSFFFATDVRHVAPSSSAACARRTVPNVPAVTDSSLTVASLKRKEVASPRIHKAHLRSSRRFQVLPAFAVPPTPNLQEATLLRRPAQTPRSVLRINIIKSTILISSINNHNHSSSITPINICLNRASTSSFRRPSLIHTWTLLLPLWRLSSLCWRIPRWHHSQRPLLIPPPNLSLTITTCATLQVPPPIPPCTWQTTQSKLVSSRRLRFLACSSTL